MDFARLPVFGLALMAALLVGCANPKELRTSGQSTSFIANVARGDSVDGWRLAAGASGDATRAWAERGAIADLGVRLRREGRTWACEFAENSIRLRSSFGVFSTGDRTGLAQTAKALGAKSEQVNALLSDVLKLSVSDLREARAAICPSA
jgi:hypothetical protein